MPEYLYPGVYVEEIDTGNKPIEGVSTSTVGFLGLSERGPTEPTPVTSFGEFVRYYGKYCQVDGAEAYLPYAVEGFFQNGGKRCVISRVTNATATAAQVVEGGWTINAIGPGEWSSRLYYTITQRDPLVPVFTLTLIYFNTDTPDLTNLNPREIQHSEVFEDLAIDAKSANFVERRVNWVSTLVMVDLPTPPTAPSLVTTLTAFPAGTAVSGITLNDFKGDPAALPGQRTGLISLEEVDEISILCCPDENRSFPDIAKELAAQAEKLRYRFAILQSELTPAGGAITNWKPSVEGSKYAAFYYPWLNIVDGTSGKLIKIPNGGHVAGVYARTDVERGVHKAPANALVLGIDSLTAELNNEQQGFLNPKGINVIRYFRGRGNRVWGARTCRAIRDWKYVNVRRLFIFVEKSIDRGTQWVVFEPNDEPTVGARARAASSDFLTRLWMRRHAAGRDAGGSVLREVRPHDDDPGRHRQRPADLSDRHRAGEAGRVRHLPHRPVDRRLE